MSYILRLVRYDENMREVGAAHVRIGEDGKVWSESLRWPFLTHVGWLDREDDRYRARSPEGSSLGVFPDRDVAIETMMRSTR